MALDKCPGVRPLGIGEIWRRAVAKCLMEVCGQEAMEACGSDQLCGGLAAGIEGAIHAMKALWKEFAEDDEPWGVLLVDARNGFNELNRYVILYAVRHFWPSGARFVFNCYKCFSHLVLRGGERLVSKEGVTQGDPLSMVAYALGLLPLVLNY